MRDGEPVGLRIRAEVHEIERVHLQKRGARSAYTVNNRSAGEEGAKKDAERFETGSKNWVVRSQGALLRLIPRYPPFKLATNT